MAREFCESRVEIMGLAKQKISLLQMKSEISDSLKLELCCLKAAQEAKVLTHQVYSDRLI